MLDGHVITAPNNVRGFDTAERLTPATMQAFFDKGYRYAVRYVRRDQVHPSDLGAAEAESLLEVGLGLMIVQHVESDTSWTPNGDKGATNGGVAAAETTAVGVPHGVSVWCDLEGVAAGTPATDVIEYCNNWHQAVAAGGYLPGLYIGWHCGLTPKQLYEELRFTHYWAGYNLNADQVPIVRGIQMKQGAAKKSDRPAGVTIDFDTDRVKADALGGRPTVVAPESWLET
jgi:hypothetical protein